MTGKFIPLRGSKKDVNVWSVSGPGGRKYRARFPVHERPEKARSHKKISKANSDMMLFASDRCLRGGNAVVASFSLANLRGFHTGAQNNDGP